LNCKIILLARAFNDLDCRLPLVYALKNAVANEVSILVVPTTGGTGLNVRHELIEKLGIKCDWFVIANKNNRFANYAISLISKYLEQSPFAILKYYVWAKVWKHIYQRLSTNASAISWLKKEAEGSIVIADDIFYQKDRSFVIEAINSDKSIKKYCLTHGQNTYLNLWEDVEMKRPFSYRLGDFVIHTPSENDQVVLQKSLPQGRILTIGNTRFDRRWVTEMRKARDSAIQWRKDCVYDE
jgi:hypothetical protein